MLSDVKPPTAHAREWQTAFLAALAETGVVCRAAAAAGVSVMSVWRARQADPAFAEAYREALGASTLRLEDEAVRRAREGVRRYLYTKGGAPVIDPA